MENLQEITCELCREIFDVFRQPVILPCGHVYCHPCLSGLPKLQQDSPSYYSYYHPINDRRACPACKGIFGNTAQLPLDYAALALAYSYWEKKQATSTDTNLEDSPGAVAPQALGYDASRRKTYELPQLIANLDKPAPRLSPYPPPTRKVIVSIYDTSRHVHKVCCGKCYETLTDTGSVPGVFLHCRSCRVQNVLLPRLGWHIRFCTECEAMIYISEDKPESKCTWCSIVPTPPGPNYDTIAVYLFFLALAVLSLIAPNPNWRK